MSTRLDPELSRLAFEDRLIEFCEDPAIPVLERVRLLAIAAERIDVLFMTRVGRLKRWAATGETHKTTATSPEEQFDSIAAAANRIMRRAYRLLDELLRALAPHDIRIERWESLAEEDRDFVRRTCGGQLRTLIRPEIVESTDAFPHVRNLRPALVAPARHSSGATARLALIELPAELPRLVRLGREHRFVPLEQVIAAELPSLCPGLDVAAAHPFRVTRSADTEFAADQDVLDSVEQEVVRRPFQEVVRLEVERDMPVSVRDQLLRAFGSETDTPGWNLGERDLYTVSGLLDLTALAEITALDLPRLKCAPVTRRAPRVDHLLEPTSTDALLHFPFDAYEESLERFLCAAARHPDLAAIQMTIYRTERNSNVIAALRDARARGADVDAVVELKASFDERENIELARDLEANGVGVVLSPPSLKVHAKVALVTFRSGDASRRVALIGTGNMNAVTARAYIDLWLLTSDPAWTDEVAALFDVLTGRSAGVGGAASAGSAAGLELENLLVAPFDMRGRFLELIERETSHAKAGRPSGIRVIVNGLSDSPIMAALCNASQAGVPVEMMVRGVCLLQPGVPDISENIRIVSVAGHLLQHARIFHFRNGGDDVYFLGSADWRPRNFDRRIEVVARVRQADHTELLDRILSDTLGAEDAWELGADGVYVRRTKMTPSASDQGKRTYVTLTPS